MQLETTIPGIYGRSKGLPWFDQIYKLDVLCIGAGGIGSHMALSLSRAGAKLYIYDHDAFEDHNGGQVMFQEDIGEQKAEAIRSTISSYSPDCEVEVFGKYVASSETGKIVFCMPDNIETRQLAFRKWRRYVDSLPESERKFCFFQDARLLAEQYRIFNIPGDNPQTMDRYYSEFLEGNRKAVQPSCTTSQTEYMAKKLVGQMMAYFTNWLCNVKYENDAREVPLSEEYFQARNNYTIIK